LRLWAIRLPDIIKKFMSAIQASNAFDLLGQSDAAPAPVHLPARANHNSK